MAAAPCRRRERGNERFPLTNPARTVLRSRAPVETVSVGRGTNESCFSAGWGASHVDPRSVPRPDPRGLMGRGFCGLGAEWAGGDETHWQVPGEARTGPGPGGGGTTGRLARERASELGFQALTRRRWPVEGRGVKHSGKGKGFWETGSWVVHCLPLWRPSPSLCLSFSKWNARARVPGFLKL